MSLNQHNIKTFREFFVQKDEIQYWMLLKLNIFSV